MSDTTAGTQGTAVRASDAERDQAVALLQCHFADGRLTLAELEERSAAAYTARTRDQLRGLTADPGRPSVRPGTSPHPLLLCLLLCLCPPAGLAYWLLHRRNEPPAAPPAIPAPDQALLGSGRMPG